MGSAKIFFVILFVVLPTPLLTGGAALDYDRPPSFWRIEPTYEFRLDLSVREPRAKRSHKHVYRDKFSYRDSRKYLRGVGR